MSILVGTFREKEDAESAVHEMRELGITDDEISIVAREGVFQEQDEGNNEEDTITYTDQDVSDGAMTGGAIGAIGGLMAGAGALAIPGVGPIVAAGPIAAGLSGAAAGGVVGGLLDMGIPEERGRQYQEEVKKGRILTIIEAGPNNVNDISSILRRHGAQNVEEH